MLPALNLDIPSQQHASSALDPGPSESSLAARTQQTKQRIRIPKLLPSTIAIDPIHRFPIAHNLGVASQHQQTIEPVRTDRFPARWASTCTYIPPGDSTTNGVNASPEPIPRRLLQAG